MTSTTLTIDQIELSPFNVRTYRPDAEDTAELEGSILAEGLLNPIAVHPLKGRKNKWGAVAGGRRCRAIRKLVNRGALEADWPIRVTHHDDASEAELILLSLAENENRRDLREHERAAGVARAIAKGLSIEAVAAGLGREASAIARFVRLGTLAPPIFAALTDQRITIEQAKAYGAVADHALQAAAFAALDVSAQPHQIRAWLKVGDRELARLLAFVGEDAYRAAGGTYQLDLFADDAEHRGRVDDEPLLRELVEKVSAKIREDTRTGFRRPDLRFVVQPPQNSYGGDDWTLEIRGVHEEPEKLPDGDVVAYIAIEDEGRSRVTFWWASSSAKYGTGGHAVSSAKHVPAAVSGGRVSPRLVGAAIGAGDGYGYAQQAKAAIREEEGVSADTVDALRNLRRLVLRAGLVEDANDGGDAGLEFLVWSVLRRLLKQEPPGITGVVGISPEPNSTTAIDLCRETPARDTWSGAIATLSAEPFMTIDDPAAAFAAFRTSTVRGDILPLAGAVVGGLLLTRSLNDAGLFVSPIHDALAEDVGLDDAAVRRLVPPGAELLDAIPTRQRLAIAEPFVETVTFATWGRLKSAELTRNVLAALTGAAAGLRASARDAAATWVHPLLRFPAANEVAADAQPELEAAE